MAEGRGVHEQLRADVSHRLSVVRRDHSEGWQKASPRRVQAVDEDGARVALMVFAEWLRSDDVQDAIERTIAFALPDESVRGDVAELVRVLLASRIEQVEG